MVIEKLLTSLRELKERKLSVVDLLSLALRTIDSKRYILYPLLALISYTV